MEQEQQSSNKRKSLEEGSDDDDNNNNNNKKNRLHDSKDLLFNDLLCPDQIRMDVLSYLPPADLCNAMTLSSRWQKECTRDVYWLPHLKRALRVFEEHYDNPRFRFDGDKKSNSRGDYIRMLPLNPDYKPPRFIPLDEWIPSPEDSPYYNMFYQYRTVILESGTTPSLHKSTESPDFCIHSDFYPDPNEDEIPHICKNPLGHVKYIEEYDSFQVLYLVSYQKKYNEDKLEPILIAHPRGSEFTEADNRELTIHVIETLVFNIHNDMKKASYDRHIHWTECLPSGYVLPKTYDQNMEITHKNSPGRRPWICGNCSAVHGPGVRMFIFRYIKRCKYCKGVYVQQYGSPSEIIVACFLCFKNVFDVEAQMHSHYSCKKCLGMLHHDDIIDEEQENDSSD
jgi:hypothetical protein